MISGFSVRLKTLCRVRFLVGFRSTQPTGRFNFYFQTHVITEIIQTLVQLDVNFFVFDLNNYNLNNYNLNN